MEISIGQALQQGVTAHNAGNLQEAERAYQAILQSQPKHPDANHNLGLIAISVNQIEAALPLFKTALNVNPNIEQFWISYIDALVKAKHLKAAKQAIKKAKKKGFDAKKLQALRSQSNGVIDNKVPPQELLNSLLEHYQNGRYDEAEKLAVTITQQFPHHHFAWETLGVLFALSGRNTEALNATEKALALDPQNTHIHVNLGNIFKEAGRFEEAEVSYKQAIVLMPDLSVAHYNLGLALQSLGRLEDAEASYSQAIVLKPDYAESHNNLGLILQTQGRIGQAQESFRQAIASKPDFAEAHFNFTIVKTFASKDAQYSKMLELYLDQDTPDDQRCYINFGLAKACQDLGDFEQAYTHYREGNLLGRTLAKYDINDDIEFFKQIRGSYPKIQSSSLAAENLTNKPTPIFIVGMPRSGTTLVEQIISSHSQVTGAGELPFAGDFGEAIARGFIEVNDAVLVDFRSEYQKKLQQVSEGNLIITDKMPHNFRYIGLLAAAFPEAKIVHVKRNSSAICWSNYQANFSAGNLAYCFAIDDIIKYHTLYEDLMKFWGKFLGERIYNLDYDILTINPKNETRQLINYLGLDWDEKCLTPQHNTRPVATASNMQVREGVYQGSSQQWKKYEPFLNGALDDLLAQ